MEGRLIHKRAYGSTVSFPHLLVCSPADFHLFSSPDVGWSFRKYIFVIAFPKPPAISVYKPLSRITIADPDLFHYPC